MRALDSARDGADRGMVQVGDARLEAVGKRQGAEAFAVHGCEGIARFGGKQPFLPADLPEQRGGCEPQASVAQQPAAGKSVLRISIAHLPMLRQRRW